MLRCTHARLDGRRSLLVNMDALRLISCPQYKGQQGVELAVKLLHDEFRPWMGLAGCRNVAEINPGYLSLYLIANEWGTIQAMTRYLDRSLYKYL